MESVILGIVGAAAAIYETWKDAGEEEKAKIESEAREKLSALESMAVYFSTAHSERTAETERVIDEEETKKTRIVKLSDLKDD